MRAGGLSLLGLLLLPTLVFVGPWSGQNGHNAPRVARSAGPPGLQKALGFVLEATPASIVSYNSLKFGVTGVVQLCLFVWEARFMGRWVDWKPVMQEASKAEEVGGDMPLGTLAKDSNLQKAIRCAHSQMECSRLTKVHCQSSQIVVFPPQTCLALLLQSHDFQRVNLKIAPQVLGSGCAKQICFFEMHSAEVSQRAHPFHERLARQ